MKTHIKFLKIQIIVLLIVVAQTVFGQIEITPMPEVTPEDLVENIVGNGVQFSNVQYTGADSASGIFSNGSSTNLGMESGIFLTSGTGYIIPGPNTSSSAGAYNGMPGDSLLTSITTYITCDASIFEFDIIPDSDTIKFRYIFGSEEYNEWVGSAFNDVFGFFVSGSNPMGGVYENKNIAIVPGTENTPIYINNINNGFSYPGAIPGGPCTNCEYFADNTGGLTLQYDGLTVALTGWLSVVPCEVYHIKMGVADAASSTYDSGVFIEENSFFSKSTQINTFTILDPTGLTEDMVEGHVEADLVVNLPSAEFAPVTICYEISGTAINGVDYEMIDNCITFNEGQDSAVIHLTPLQDGIAEYDETIRLIIHNTLGCDGVYDTVELIIKDYSPAIIVMSPNTTVCSEQPLELWIDVNWGFPPYTYNWQPGSYTNDTIVVNPEETTTYTVTYLDIFEGGGTDSTTVFVFPDDQNDMMAFSFEMENNPGLPWDAIGDINGDTIMVILPEGPAMDSLVASFVVSNCASAYVNGTEQVSGITANNFTEPIIYGVTAQNGAVKEWTVVVDIETGITDEIADELTLFPNPSEGKFYLETTYTGGDPIELQVMDLTGRIVYQTVTSNLDKTEIDLSDQPKGMYFIRIKSGEMVVNRKVVMQ